MAWRLPRANELRHLVNKEPSPRGESGAVSVLARHLALVQLDPCAGGINAYNYGNVMQGSTGGTSSQLGSFRNGWAVDMATGEASGDVARSSRLPVRLVRPYD